MRRRLALPGEHRYPRLRRPAGRPPRLRPERRPGRPGPRRRRRAAHRPRRPARARPRRRDPDAGAGSSSRSAGSPSIDPDAVVLTTGTVSLRRFDKRPGRDAGARRAARPPGHRAGHRRGGARRRRRHGADPHRLAAHPGRGAQRHPAPARRDASSWSGTRSAASRSRRTSRAPPTCWPCSRSCAPPTSPACCTTCPASAAPRSPPPSTTSGSPTSSRSCPRTSRSSCSAGLEDERAADVLEAMAPDDAADLLGELRRPRRPRLLDLMAARRGRRRSASCCLQRRHRRRPDDERAGDPRPDHHRRRGARPDPQRRPVARRWPPRSTSCRPPYETPTGRYLGTVHFQRLLREPPSSLIARSSNDIDPLAPDCPLPRSPATWRRTTSSPCRSSTPSSGCSARSPSTTCWTTCCRRTGANAARAPAVAERPARPGPARPAASSRAGSPRPHYDPEAFGRVQRADRPLPRHRPLPRLPDAVRHRLAGLEHLRARSACSSTRGR